MTDLAIQIDETHTVSAVLRRPDNAVACYVMAHGAGAGMHHPFMNAVAEGLAERQIATLRFQFPYMEAGSKRPYRPALAQATVRRAVASAPALPLFAGGKSFGARMTSRRRQSIHCLGSSAWCSWGFPCIRPANLQPPERRTLMG